MNNPGFAICMVVLMFLTGWASAQPPSQDWSQFDLEPLTIIYPEDEALSNPPFIHWQAVPEADYYLVTLKHEQGVEEWKLSRNFYTPEKDMPLGFASVEVSAYAKDGTRLLEPQTKSFRLTKEGSGLDMKLNEVAFPQGKRFIMTDEQVSEILKAKGRQGEYRERFLEYARKPRHESLVNLQEPPRYPDGVWEFNLWHRNNSLCGAAGDFITAQAFAYRLTGEKEFFENARGVALTLAQWDPVGSTGVWENDHSAWSVLQGLSYAYNIFQDELSEEDKQSIAKSIRLRCEDMYRFQNPFLIKFTSAGGMNDPDNNHPWFCTAALGLGAMALMGEVEDAEDWLSFASQMFYGMYLPRGCRDGGWHEGISYWSYTLYFVFQFSDALKIASDVNLYRHPWLENTAFFKIYIHPPQGACVPFGDSKPAPPSSFDKLVMFRLASEYDDPLAWRYVDYIEEEIPGFRLPLALLWSGQKEDYSKAKLDIPFAVHFRDIGWVVSNNNVFDGNKQILFAMRSGPFFGKRFGHSHADQNHFIITAGGERLIWDSGYYDSYLSPHHRQFSSQSVAHNVILVDGHGQVAFTSGTDAEITRYELDGKNLLVQGDASNPLIYGGRVYTFVRTIRYENEETFVIQDDIVLRELAQVSWLLQSFYPIVYHPGDKTILIQGEQYQIEGQFKTSIPVEAMLYDTFPVQPELKGRTDYNPEEVFPKNYRLELKTTEKLETWQPELTLTLSPMKK